MEPLPHCSLLPGTGWYTGEAPAHFWRIAAGWWCSWTTWHHPVAKIENIYQTFLWDRGCLVTSTSGGSCLQFGFWTSSAPYREGERREEEGGEREAEFRPWEHHAAALTPDDLYACVSTHINGVWSSGASLLSYAWVLTGIVGTSLFWWPSQHHMANSPQLCSELSRIVYDSFLVHLRRTCVSCVCGRKLLAVCDLACLSYIMDGVIGWCERHRQCRALEWAAVSVWKGFITSYGEHKAGIPWKQNCGFWDGTNKIGLFFHCSGERWPSEKPILPPPPLP